MSGRVVEVLYNSEDVRKAVRRIYRAAGRRVAVVGFVGQGAEAYLPRASGIELYCWPHPGSTSAPAIKKLQGLGVEVSFSDRLHAKVYWSSRGGAVVTSANLSTNAYGRGRLKEFGVWLPPGHVDIDRVIRSCAGKPVTAKALAALELATKKVARLGGAPGGQRTFRQWFEKGRGRERWLLGFMSGSAPVARRIRELVKEEHNVRTIQNWVSCKRGEVQEDDYLLVFTLKGNAVSAPVWIHADHVARIDRNERGYESSYPMQVGQVWPLKRYRPAPFDLDPSFRRAARSVLRDALMRDFDHGVTAPAPAALLRALYGAYLDEERR